MQNVNIRILWYLFLATIFVQLVGGILYYIIFADTALVQSIYLLTKILMLLAPIGLIFFGFRLPKLNLTQQVKKSVVWGTLSGLLISGLILVVFFLFKTSFSSIADNVLVKVEDFGIIGYFIITAILFSLLHSLFEEYFWRWFVVHGLETKLSSASAVLLGALFFAMHHYIVLSQFFPIGITIIFGTFVGVGGIIWSWIYNKTDSLLGPWISHIIVDGTIFLIGWMLIR
jgi:uncharacterized protein